MSIIPVFIVAVSCTFFLGQANAASQSFQSHEAKSLESGAEAFASCSRNALNDWAGSELSSVEIAKKMFMTCREHLPADIRYFEHYEEMMIPQLTKIVEAVKNLPTLDN